MNHYFFSFQYIQLCAWACDDENDVKNSKVIRKIGIDLINKILESENNIFRTDDWLAIKFDWIRRIGDFENLIKEYENLDLNDSSWKLFFSISIRKSKK